MFVNVKIRMTHLETGVNCEFDMGAETTAGEVKGAIKALFENGFVKTASSAAVAKPDVAGKTGNIVAIEKVADKKQWKVTVTLHETGAGQVVFTAFDDKWRKGDRVRLSKNDKGYTDATLITDEDLDGKTQNSIPF